MLTKWSFIVACSYFISIAAIANGQTASSDAQKDDGDVVEYQKVESIKLSLADGELQVESPDIWEVDENKGRMLDYLFAFPAKAEDDDPTVRITISRAGGGVKPNLDRWKTQFDAKDGDPEPSIEEKKIGDYVVHVADISGDYAERVGGGPFGGGKVVNRESYRMLGAIIETKKGGLLFVKATGPRDLVEAMSESFHEFLKAACQ